MTRRLALAVALAFTTVVTFALVAIGAQAGLFGDGGKDGKPAEASVAETLGQTPTPEPTVVTEYIYVDQTVTPVPSGAPSQDSSGGAVDTSGQVSGGDSGSGASFAQSAPAPAGDEHDDDEHEDDHHESEHEEGDD